MPNKRKKVERHALESHDQQVAAPLCRSLGTSDTQLGTWRRWGWQVAWSPGGRDFPNRLAGTTALPTVLLLLLLLPEHGAAFPHRPAGLPARAGPCFHRVPCSQAWAALGHGGHRGRMAGGLSRLLRTPAPSWSQRCNVPISVCPSTENRIGIRNS